MKNSDRDFLARKTKEHQVSLPESLSADNISRLVENADAAEARPAVKAVKPGRRGARFIVSAAAMIAISVALAIGINSIPRPTVVKNENPISQTVAPVTRPGDREVEPDYGELAKLLKKNFETREKKSRRYFFKGATEDYAVAEAVEGVNSAAAPTPDAGYGASPTRALASADSVNSADASELNTRTEGVDETEIFRTDGKYIYLLSGSYRYYYGGYYYGAYYYDGGNEEKPACFRVIDPNGGDMKVVCELPIERESLDDGTVRERYFTGFYLYKGMAILTGSLVTYTPVDANYDEEGEYWDVYPNDVKNSTVIRVLDLSDPEKVSVAKEFFYDGDLLDTRLTSDKLIAVTRFNVDRSGFVYNDFKTFVPCAGEDSEPLAPSQIAVGDEEGTGYSVVSVISTNDFSASTLAVLGDYDEIYCTGGNIYCYGWSYGDSFDDDFMNVAKVDVASAAPVLTATGKYKNVWLLDSFSLDEYDGYLRMAITVSSYDISGNWGGSKNQIIVLDGDLNVIGRSASFGDGEQIKSVRFEGATAYAVTFYNTDPLFSFDLSDPTNPVITGELKLPGYSAYLHPAGDGLMIGVGQDGTDSGLNGGAKISLFNVSDPADPVEIDRITISNGWFSGDYKDFITKGENGYIVKYTKWNEGYGYSNSGGEMYIRVVGGKLELVSDCALDDGITVNKALFIGDGLYIYADACIPQGEDPDYIESYDQYTALFSFDLNTGDEIAMLKF